MFRNTSTKFDFFSFFQFAVLYNVRAHESWNYINGDMKVGMTTPANSKAKYLFIPKMILSDLVQVPVPSNCAQD